MKHEMRSSRGSRMPIRHRSHELPPAPPLSLDLLAECPPAEADQILLSCFGLDLAGTCHRRDLYYALQLAGYTGPLA
jgi:hypothetical protein